MLVWGWVDRGGGFVRANVGAVALGVTAMAGLAVAATFVLSSRRGGGRALSEQLKSVDRTVVHYQNKMIRELDSFRRRKAKIMDEQVDDRYSLSALADADDLFPISDEKYAAELQLQEVLMSSFIAAADSYGLPRREITEKEQDVPSSSSVKRLRIEQGGPSKAVELCKICMEAYPLSQIFFGTNCCSHAFCHDCLGQYIDTRLRDNISAIKCPGERCPGRLEPEDCQDIIPREVFERWGSALCESMVLGARKSTYCPFKDCNALLLLSGGDVGGGGGEAVIDRSECPHCRRLFCASCRVAPWHLGLSCREVKRLGGGERGGEDLKLAEMAKRNKWKRCPNCKYYVEKTQGCLHITCRCKYEFCYRCGKKWRLLHSC